MDYLTKEQVEKPRQIQCGLTPIGRATVQALELNRATMVAIRAEEELLGRHPPQ